jgi:hypothetical protein
LSFWKSSIAFFISFSAATEFFLRILAMGEPEVIAP